MNDKQLRSRRCYSQVESVTDIREWLKMNSITFYLKGIFKIVPRLGKMHQYCRGLPVFHVVITSRLIFITQGTWLFIIVMANVVFSSCDLHIAIAATDVMATLC
jgi:uncharacterized membrane protein SirB2